MSEKPVIVTLCGSTKFKDEFVSANLRETLKGKIVLSIGCDTKTDDDIFGHLSEEEFKKTKEKLDWLHKRKIDISDEILVLDVNGYIGESTKGEIDHAKSCNKRIRYLSEESEAVDE